MIKSINTSNFLNGFDADKFKGELASSSISIGLADIKDFATKIQFKFTDDLTSEDENAFTALIENHHAGVSIDSPNKTTDPTVNDDITKGYHMLSKWGNKTTKKEFSCVDNTEGAAVGTLEIVPRS